MSNKNGSSSRASASGGVGFFGLLFIVLLVMKLMKLGGVGEWSWWWVAAPLWIPAGIGLIVLVIVFILMRK